MSRRPSVGWPRSGAAAGGRKTKFPRAAPRRRDPMPRPLIHRFLLAGQIKPVPCRRHAGGIDLAKRERGAEAAVAGMDARQGMAVFPAVARRSGGGENRRPPHPGGRTARRKPGLRARGRGSRPGASRLADPGKGRAAMRQRRRRRGGGPCAPAGAGKRKRSLGGVGHGKSGISAFGPPRSSPPGAAASGRGHGEKAPMVS